MERQLKTAACVGDIDFLKRAFDTKPPDYLESYWSPDDEDREIMGNIFHLAARKGKLEFMKEAMKTLPDDLVLRLLSQQDEDGWNPLHVAASETDCLKSVSLILGFYKSQSIYLENGKPWLALTEDDRTPLHIVLSEEEKTEDDEECALQILSMDKLELFCNIVDENETSPLYLAVKYGFNRVAEKILMSSPSSYSVSGQNGSTPLHFAPNSSENVLRLLLKKHSELLDKIDDETGFNVVHQWAELKKKWVFQFLEKGEFPVANTKIFIDLINSTTEKKRRDNPLHTAARITGNPEIGRHLIKGYQREIKARNKVSSHNNMNCPPWEALNTFLETPLLIAIWSSNQDLALDFLLIDSTLCHLQNIKGESPLLFAVRNGTNSIRVVEQILTIIHDGPYFSALRSNNGRTVLHFLRHCPEDIGKRILNKCWWMMNLLDDTGKTALDYAKEKRVLWLVKMLRNPTLIEKEPFDWITACKQNETWAVEAYVDICQDLLKVCRKKKDTPLHHIKFQTYKEYSKFLKKPSVAEIKNLTDFEGATPLHRALEKKDIYLAKALLIDDEVERTIKNDHGINAMTLLSELYKANDEWKTMCRQINVNPVVKQTYLQHGTNLDQMRNTLSVVAALLATITFAAGFTVPGGFDQETGYAMLAKKVSFIVFLLADTFAMCTSMIVLVCMILTMVVSDQHMSSFLVDRSVRILILSLYGTLVAFMTGIYTVIKQSSLWVALLIFFFCSLVVVSTSRRVLRFIYVKLEPAANLKQLDKIQLQDQVGDSVRPKLWNVLDSIRLSFQRIVLITSKSDDSLQNAEQTSSHQNLTQSDDELILLEEGEASISGNGSSKKAK